MDEFEKVERLRTYGDITYEEAKQALEQNNWDLLEAVVYLERQGKLKKPEQTSYTTQYEEPQKIEQAAQSTEQREGIGTMMSRFCEWFKKIVKKSCENYFNVDRYGKRILSVPVLVLVIAAILAFWLVLILAVVGLFLNCRYSFSKPVNMQVDLNEAMDRAADTAENLKKNFRKEDSDK